MLTRQKLVLELLRQAGRAVSKLELMKWAFVLSKESETRGGDSFYEFLPYHYGPFSFALQRDLQTFSENATIVESEHNWEWNKSQVVDYPLTKPLTFDAMRIVTRFRNITVNETINYVYRKYPLYTVNSKRERLATRNIAEPAIYTSGYEGLQIDGFLDRLIQSGIQQLIDVRNNPIARRYGFHKSTLNRLCSNLEIEYRHFPELGIVSSERQELVTQDDYNQLFERYELQTLSQQQASLSQLAELMMNKSSVLVCMEAEACRCHRSRLSETVSRHTGLKVVHLGNEQ
jgi:uncharacterized protein (DUF488 family)